MVQGPTSKVLSVQSTSYCTLSVRTLVLFISSSMISLWRQGNPIFIINKKCSKQFNKDIKNGLATYS